MEDDSYWSNIFRKETKKIKNIYTVLKHVPIFQDLNKKELKAIERILHRRTYKAGEAIFNENEPGFGMYIIESGKIYINAGKDQKLLAVLSEGDFFGEMALLLEIPRTASAVSHEPSQILGFFQPDLFGLLETKPRTGNKVLKCLAQIIAKRLRQGTLENRELKIKLNELEKKSKPKKGK
jgi:CRP-like cAMP-binding protein